MTARRRGGRLERTSRATWDSSRFAAVSSGGSPSSGTAWIPSSGVTGRRFRRRISLLAWWATAVRTYLRFLVVEFVMTTLQGPKGSNPGVRVDVLDLVIGEGATESTANHRSSGSTELLVETARSLPPCGRVLRRDCDRAGGGDRGH